MTSLFIDRFAGVQWREGSGSGELALECRTNKADEERKQSLRSLYSTVRDNAN